MGMVGFCWKSLDRTGTKFSTKGNNTKGAIDDQIKAPDITLSLYSWIVADGHLSIDATIFFWKNMD